MTCFKFPDISRFSRQVVTLSIPTTFRHRNTPLPANVKADSSPPRGRTLPVTVSACFMSLDKKVNISMPTTKF